MKPKHRALRVTLAALLFVPWAFLHSAVFAQDRIRVGLGSISLQSGLVHIAKDRGLFTKYGLTTESIYIPGGSVNVQVLVSGSLDLSQLSGAPGVAANLEGADLVYILGLLESAASALRRISACALCSSALTWIR
jgi:ABC-type nitrate/sulfonate/bicarbonate transport system substrate-binding protein